MESIVARFKAMGSPCEFRFYGSDSNQLECAVTQCLLRIQDLEAKYSRYLDASIVSMINESAGCSEVLIDEETYYLLRYAAACFEQSDGLFDITSGVLRKVWNKEIKTLPSEERIDSCLKKVGFQKLVFTEDSAYLPITGMELDFGGIVKEYASDVISNQAQSLGVTAGIVNLGGDLSCFGQAPEHSFWQIGIAHPKDSKRAIAEINIPSGAITTSGCYERYFEIDEHRFSHLLDPRSGWPVEGLMSVSIVADQAVVAGSLTTISMLKPEDEALHWLESLNVPFLAIDRHLNKHGSLRSPDLNYGS